MAQVPMERLFSQTGLSADDSSDHILQRSWSIQLDEHDATLFTLPSSGCHLGPAHWGCHGLCAHCYSPEHFHALLLWVLSLLNEVTVPKLQHEYLLWQVVCPWYSVTCIIRSADPSSVLLDLPHGLSRTSSECQENDSELETDTRLLGVPPAHGLACSFN